MSWPVVTRERAVREGHPAVKVGDVCWYVPQVALHEYGPLAVPVRLLGGGGSVREPLEQRYTIGAVSVELLADATPLDGTVRVSGQVVRVPRREVGPDTLRQHAADRAADPDRRDAYGMRPMPPKWALDLFCPVHGYIHRVPAGLCEGDPQPAPPLPGDALRLASRWNWGALESGEIGVLGGVVGTPIQPEGGSGVTFNARAYRDDHIVQCSGGPATAWTSPEELIRTTDTVTLTVWEWKDGFPNAGSTTGVDYQVTVPVWDWHPRD